MRPAANHLDLNNLPEDYGKQALEESSTTTAASTETIRFKKKKGAGAKDEAAKVYECRFCSLKFCKSQALGGHMNRHRQERETETLNRARQLVFSNEAHSGAGAHLGYRDLNMGGSGSPQGFQQLRPVYPRLPTQASAQHQPPVQPPYINYPSSAPHPVPYPHPSPIGEYFIGHVLSSSAQRPPQHQSYGLDSSYACFGAPLSHGFPVEGVRAPASGQAEGRINWSTHAPGDRIRDGDNIN